MQSEPQQMSQQIQSDNVSDNYNYSQNDYSTDNQVNYENIQTNLPSEQNFVDNTDNNNYEYQQHTQSQDANYDTYANENNQQYYNSNTSESDNSFENEYSNFSQYYQNSNNDQQNTSLNQDTYSGDAQYGSSDSYSYSQNNEYTNESSPSPLYQSNNYFDENNEVNYVSSFADLFKIEENPEPVQSAPEYDYMSMNEMIFKYQAKGITIKPYSKKNTMEFYVNRYYYSNKLHLHTSLIMFLLMAVEIIVAHFICNRTNPISNLWLFSILILLAYPIIRLTMYLIEPHKKALANFNPKTALLISILPVITMPIVIALLGFVQFGANIGDYSSMERSIILPCVLLFNIPFYFIVYAILYRTNNYHIN